MTPRDIEATSERPSERVRREPPSFRHLVVARTEHLTDRMIRVTLTGPDLDGFTIENPAASVRLLLPQPDSPELVVPSWNGNEFLLPDGRRPTIRTFTPLRLNPEAFELDLEIVVHDTGAASAWTLHAAPGDRVAISGPGRGYAIEPGAPSFFLGGDESAIPAISQLLDALPSEEPVQVHIEVSHPGARLALPNHPRATVEWHDLTPGTRAGAALIAAVSGADLDPATRVWVAGNAAAMQRIRRHLFEDRGLPRAQAVVRGYWKHARLSK